MIKGRGSWFEALAKETSDFMPGCSKIQVCRPLKEFLPKEIYYYMHSNHVTQYLINRPNLTTQSSKKVASLPGMGNFTKVLDDFLNRLQKDYPSTIFTVLNTTEKVKVDLELLRGTLVTGGKGDDGKIIKPLEEIVSDESSADSRCLMCRGTIDPSNPLESGFDHLLVGNPDPESMTLANLQHKFLQELTPLEKSICYGCKRIVRGASNQQLMRAVFGGGNPPQTSTMDD
jgi:Cytoplasmic tRNA 2-thiolation protein 2